MKDQRARRDTPKFFLIFNNINFLLVFFPFNCCLKAFIKNPLYFVRDRIIEERLTFRARKRAIILFFFIQITNNPEVGNFSNDTEATRQTSDQGEMPKNDTHRIDSIPNGG